MRADYDPMGGKDAASGVRPTLRGTYLDVRDAFPRPPQPGACSAGATAANSWHEQGMGGGLEKFPPSPPQVFLPPLVRHDRIRKKLAFSKPSHGDDPGRSRHRQRA
jgi:hypothetical protein